MSGNRFTRSGLGVRQAYCSVSTRTGLGRGPSGMTLERRCPGLVGWGWRRLWMGHVPKSSVMSVLPPAVLLGVMQLQMHGGLSASGDRTHVTIGAGKCCHPLWS